MGYLYKLFSFENFAGQASQRGKELVKERKEKGSPEHKEKARNQLANLDENRERKKPRSNYTLSCCNECRLEFTVCPRDYEVKITIL